MSKKNVAAVVRKSESKHEEIAQLRVLAHDLSNALEAILQASYLLGQAKLDANSHRWAQLIDSSSQQAARINRDMRKLLRSLSED
jgi:signal transduction histidine kinase